MNRIILAALSSALATTAVWGQFSNATSLQNRPISPTAPTDLYVLTWNASTNAWTPTAAGGGSFGNQSANVVFAGPASGSATTPTFRALVTADLPGSTTGSPPPTAQSNGDFWVVRTSATILTIGPACSATYPCRISFGTTIFTLTTPATATISAGSDTAYIYVSDAQVLTVGTAADTVVCSGCTASTGISAFPATSFPLWNWTASAGTWALAGGTDQRVVTQKGADPLASYLLYSADTQLKNAKVMSRAVTFNINGGGAEITTGDVLSYPGTGANTGTITRVDISGYGTAGAACSITVDLWKVNAAIPTGSNKISASAPATLSSANLSQSGSISGWTTAVAANDVWGASVASVTGCISALVQVWYQ